MRIAAISACVLAAGCASTRPGEPVIVKVPIAVACIVDLPPEVRITPNDELREMSDYRLLLTIARERLTLIAYGAELRAQAKACEQ